MIVKNKVGRPPQGRERESFTVEYHAERRLKERLDVLARKNMRSKTAEAVIAIEEYLAKHEGKEAVVG